MSDPAGAASAVSADAPPLAEGPRWLLPVAAGLGALFFFVVLSPAIIVPTHVDWLASGDPAQSYLGWAFFRDEPWSWPLGAHHRLGLEQAASLVYTDSIPLLALPLKVFDQALPDDFQYHGLWLLACYVLQGYFACRLLSSWSRRPLFVLAGTLVLIAAPILLRRSDMHFALCAHWIPLAALYLFRVPPSAARSRQWLALLWVATLVHAYLLLMAFCVFAAYLLHHGPLTGAWRWRRVLSHAGLALAGTIALMWAAGYFTSMPTSVGFELFSMNLLAPFFPTGDGPFLMPALETATPGQHEGFNYLGLGVLFALVLALVQRITARGEPKTTTPWRRRPGFALGIGLTPLALMAITSQPTLGPHVLFSLRGDGVIWRALDIFRASGRLFWPIYYLIVLAALGALARLPPRQMAVALGAVIALQVADLAPYLGHMREHFAAMVSDRHFPTFLSPFWAEARARYPNLYVVQGKDDRDWLGTVSLAHQYGFATDTMYFARYPPRAAQVQRATRGSDFDRGVLATDGLFIVKPSGRARFEQARELLPPSTGIGVIDGFQVVAPNWFDEAGAGHLARPAP